MYNKEISEIPVFSKVGLSEDGNCIIFPESVAIIGQDEQDKFILVEQFRELKNIMSIELPGGRVDKNETIHNAINRELMEEAGYFCESPKLIMSLDMDLSVSKHITHIFSGKLRYVKKSTEKFRIHCLSEDDFLKLISNNSITHCPTVVAFYWYISKKNVK